MLLVIRFLPYQWGLVHQTIQLRSPFEEITKEASNRTSTISMIIPTILALRLFLSKAVQSNSDISDFSGILLTNVEQFSESMETRFSSNLNDKNLCVSTFLDPRFKFFFKMTWKTPLRIGFYIIYFLLMIMKQNQDRLQALLRVKKIRVKVKLYLFQACLMN